MPLIADNPLQKRICKKRPCCVRRGFRDRLQEENQGFLGAAKPLESSSLQHMGHSPRSFQQKFLFFMDWTTCFQEQITEAPLSVVHFQWLQTAPFPRDSSYRRQMACVPVTSIFFHLCWHFGKNLSLSSLSERALLKLWPESKARNHFFGTSIYIKGIFFLQIIVLCDYFSMHGDKLNQWPSERLRGTAGPRNVDHKSFVWEENANKSKLCYKGWSQNHKQAWPNGLSPVERLSPGHHCVLQV